jgi:hypothetical protein
MSNGNTKEEINIQRTRHLPLRYRAQPYLTPWLLMAGVFVIAVITHQFLNGPVAMFFLAVWVIGTAVVTWKTWDRRHEHARVAATAFTAGMGLWMLLATAAGPVWQPMIYMYVLGGSFLALTWNIRYAGITPTNKHDAVKTGPVDAVSQIKGLKQTTTGKVKTFVDNVGARAEVILNHPGGKNTTADVKRKKDNIAGLYGVETSQVKVSEHKGGQSRVDIRLTNPTTDVVLYPGLSMIGRSITAGPLRTGVREDGADSGHWVTGDDETSRAASATLYSGQTGSGKTLAFILAWLEMISRTDCAPPVIMDPEKFMLSFGHVMEFLDLAADGPEQTNQLISNLPEAMRYRARLLGSQGYRFWVPECYTKHGIPVQPIHTEEAAGYLANNPSYQKAINLCRALGMPISASVQVAGFRQIERAVRSQFGNSLAFGVRERQDAVFALLDETMRAGADPSRWSNNHPGKHIAEVTGVPSEQWPLTHRTYKISEEETVATFELCRNAGWAKCDEGTFALLSKGIERPRPMIIGVPDWKPPADDFGEAPTVSLDDLREPVEDARPFEPRVIQGGAEEPEQRPDAEEAYQLIADRIEELELSNVAEITADDFDDLKEELARDRTWIYKSAFPIMVKRGRLARLSGKGSRYRIIPREDQKEL